MKIAHVVTYVSPDGAFGGPVRVALGQAAALAERGHDVTVFAASPDPAPRRIHQDGYLLRLFPAHRLLPRLGFAGMRARGLTRALRTDLASFDVVHIHLARDLVTLPAARAVRKAGVKLIAQPHGMIDKSTNPLAIPVDAWETRAALAAASAVLTLTDQERRDVQSLVGKVNAQPIGNGIKTDKLPPYAERAGGVVFLARLHPRKRPLVFVEAAIDVLARRPATRFVLAGPDEGEGASVNQMIASASRGDRIEWIGPVNPASTDALLRDAEVFVLPSVGEVFPMTILEAFKAGTPVVTTSSLGIAAKCEKYGAALVTDGSVRSIAEAVERILTSPGEAERLRLGAKRFIDAELSIDVVVDRLLDLYTAEPATQEGSR